MLSQAGEANQAGLPEICGEIAAPAAHKRVGAFFDNGDYIKSFLEIGQPYNDMVVTYFNASKSNSVYGLSETVIPASIDLLAIIYLGK